MAAPQLWARACQPSILLARLAKHLPPFPPHLALPPLSGFCAQCRAWGTPRLFSMLQKACVLPVRDTAKPCSPLQAPHCSPPISSLPCLPICSACCCAPLVSLWAHHTNAFAGVHPAAHAAGLEAVLAHAPAHSGVVSGLPRARHTSLQAMHVRVCVPGHVLPSGCMCLLLSAHVFGCMCVCACACIVDSHVRSSQVMPVGRRACACWPQGLCLLATGPGDACWPQGLCLLATGPVLVGHRAE